MTAANLDTEGLEAYFTDVEKLRAYFASAVAANPLPKRLLVIWGIGGIGKTTLLRMYRIHCKQVGVPVGLVSGDEEKTAVEVLARWHDDLKGDGVKLKAFAKTYSQYRAIQAKVEQRAQKTESRITEIAHTAASKAAETAAGAAAGIALGSMLPGIGTAIGGVLGGAAGAAGAEVSLGWLRGFLSRPEIDLLLDPVKRLTEDFLSDTSGIARNRRIVLLLDTFEQMAEFDDWVRELARQLSPNILFVLAGRGSPTWDRNWPEWTASARVEELDPMDEPTMEQLIQRYYALVRGDYPDPNQVAHIIRFSRGLPMVVTSAVRLWVEYGVEDFEAVKPEVVSDLADRLREGVSQRLYPALEAAAILRWFNQELLGALIGGEDVRAAYDELRRFPFVRSRHEGLALHDAVREIMNDDLRSRAPAQHRTLHSRAAEHLGTAAVNLPLAQAENYALEQLYHLLQIDEVTAVSRLEALFERAHWQGRREFQQKLLSEFSRHEFRNTSPKHRFQFLLAGTETSWPALETNLKRLLDENLESTLRARVIRALAGPLGYQGKRGELLPLLKEAIAICEGIGSPVEAAWTRLELCWQVDLDESGTLVDQAMTEFQSAGDDSGLASALAQLGWNRLNRWEPEASRNAFFKSLALWEKLGNLREAAFVRERIGQTYLIEGDYYPAIKAKESALKVFEAMEDRWNTAWTLDELATCYIGIGRWHTTLPILERARVIFAEWNDHRETACVVRQGSIYRLQGRLGLAEKTYRHALEDLPSHGAWTSHELLTGLGMIHQIRGDFGAALSFFNQADLDFKKRGYEVQSRMTAGWSFGHLLLAQGRPAEALEHYTACTREANAHGSHKFESAGLIGRCEALYALQRWTEFTTTASAAQALGERYHLYEHLADVHALLGHRALRQGASAMVGSGIPEALYRQALQDALLFNRFRLDQILDEIGENCLRCGDSGRHILAALRDWWKAGRLQCTTPDSSPLIPMGTILLEAERIARYNEPGDGSQQISVVEALNAKLAEQGMGDMDGHLS